MKYKYRYKRSQKEQYEQISLTYFCHSDDRHDDTWGNKRNPEKSSFVCEHGAAKSIIAKAEFERLVKEKGLTELGETTPGPLIMVAAFVEFVGGYYKAFFGPNLLPVAGIVAASVVMWFTFLPSFVFILAGGPIIESTRQDLKFTAPLTAITAGVVGVILNLALFFGYHVLWPNGLQAHLTHLLH